MSADHSRDFNSRLDAIIDRNPTPPSTEEDDRRWRVDRARQRCDDRFPAHYCEARTDRPEILHWVQRYHREPASAPSLLILGPVGGGKTHLAYAALRAAVEQPYPVRWEAGTAADLLAQLRPRAGVDTEETLRRLVRTHVLLIDDLGVGKTSEWSEETLYRLINSRYVEDLPCIVTSNIAPRDLSATLGDRIASRLAGMCQRVVVNGPDRRRTDD